MKVKGLEIGTRCEEYSFDAISKTMTAGELIKVLSRYDENMPVYLSFGKAYMYGSILESRMVEHYEDNDEEDEVGD